MKEKIKLLQKMIKSSDNIVFFGGAGVSTESGLPDFRSTDGLYFQTYEYPPEKILSHSFFYSNPEEFYRFYFSKMISLDVKPNKAHKALSYLEEKGKLKAVITQNIDGLHQEAGSKNVLELHGSVHRNYCTKCGSSYSVEDIAENEQVPHCTKCTGLIKPDVVLYEESLDSQVLSDSVHYISEADMVIIGGTSLTVYPAAGLLDYYQGSKLVLINKDSTQLDNRADLVIQDRIGDILEEAVNGI